MDVDRQYKEIPAERINATRFQARQQNIDANVDDLAASIEQPASAISVADGGNGTATVTFSAASVPAGTYVFWISASDGKESEREPFVVIVQ